MLLSKVVEEIVLGFKDFITLDAGPGKIVILFQSVLQSGEDFVFYCLFCLLKLLLNVDYFFLKIVESKFLDILNVSIGGFKP